MSNTNRKQIIFVTPKEDTIVETVLDELPAYFALPSNKKGGGLRGDARGTVKIVTHTTKKGEITHVVRFLNHAKQDGMNARIKVGLPMRRDRNLVSFKSSSCTAHAMEPIRTIFFLRFGAVDDNMDGDDAIDFDKGCEDAKKFERAWKDLGGSVCFSSDGPARKAEIREDSIPQLDSEAEVSPKAEAEAAAADDGEEDDEEEEDGPPTKRLKSENGTDEAVDSDGGSAPAANSEEADGEVNDNDVTTTTTTVYAIDAVIQSQNWQTAFDFS